MLYVTDVLESRFIG